MEEKAEMGQGCDVRARGMKVTGGAQSVFQVCTDA